MSKRRIREAGRVIGYVEEYPPGEFYWRDTTGNGSSRCFDLPEEAEQDLRSQMSRPERDRDY
jgi:hypothetical protein